METSEKRITREMVMGLRVFGTANAKTEEVYCLDVGTALKQDRAFKMAGYSDVAISPAYVTFDENGECYHVRIENGVVLAKEVVTPKCSRAQIYPGINVREYDRERERNQRVTGIQVVIAVLMTLVIGAAPGLYIGLAATAGINGSPAGKTIFVGISAFLSLLATVALPSIREKAISTGAQIAGIYWIEET